MPYLDDAHNDAARHLSALEASAAEPRTPNPYPRRKVDPMTTETSGMLADLRRTLADKFQRTSKRHDAAVERITHLEERVERIARKIAGLVGDGSLMVSAVWMTTTGAAASPALMRVDEGDIDNVINDLVAQIRVEGREQTGRILISREIADDLVVPVREIEVRGEVVASTIPQTPAMSAMRRFLEEKGDGPDAEIVSSLYNDGRTFRLVGSHVAGERRIRKSFRCAGIIDSDAIETAIEFARLGRNGWVELQCSLDGPWRLIHVLEGNDHLLESIEGPVFVLHIFAPHTNGGVVWTSYYDVAESPDSLALVACEFGDGGVGLLWEIPAGETSATRSFLTRAGDVFEFKNDGELHTLEDLTRTLRGEAMVPATTAP